MINGRPACFSETAWRDYCKQVFLGNRVTIAQLAQTENHIYILAPIWPRKENIQYTRYTETMLQPPFLL